MSSARFRGTVMSGHKEDAVEVPFDPGAKWKIDARQIRPGRRGFAVRATIDGTSFDSYVVARSQKFWLLLPTDVEAQAGISCADAIAVTLRPATPVI